MIILLQLFFGKLVHFKKELEHDFKFTSGNANPWQNEWGVGTIAIDNTGALDYPGSSNANITLTQDATIVAIWQDVGYSPTKASFLDLGANASGISSITEASPPSVSGSDVGFIVSSNAPVDPTQTNELVWAVYAVTGTTTISEYTLLLHRIQIIVISHNQFLMVHMIVIMLFLQRMQ